MLDIKKISNPNEFKKTSKKEFIEFLYNHLDRFGDSK